MTIRLRGMGLAAAIAGSFSAAIILAAPALADPVDLPAPPAPGQDATVQQLGGDPLVLPDGVPHLASPENLPPGTSDEPVGPPQGRGMSYLRELWHAVQTQDVTMNEAVFLLTQRPLDANATPPAGLPAGPQPPLTVPQPLAAEQPPLPAEPPLPVPPPAP